MVSEQEWKNSAHVGDAEVVVRECAERVRAAAMSSPEQSQSTGAMGCAFREHAELEVHLS